MGAGDAYTPAGGQHLDHAHGALTNPRFPTALCAVAYPSALIAMGAAAALGFWDGAPSQGGWWGHPQPREQGCCGVAATQVGTLAVGSKHCLATGLALEWNGAEGV